MVPTYAANGRRLFDHTVAAIERLLVLSRVVVKKSRKGKILAATYRPLSGASPIAKTAHRGTRYSYWAHINEVHVWTHRRMIQAQDLEYLMGEMPDDPEEAERFVQAVFRAVPLSCMPKRPKAKVVSIESGRKHPIRLRTNRTNLSERKAA